MNHEQVSHDTIPEIYWEMRQGSQEWLELRKSKITATDAVVIMGASHWKTKIQLYKEKTGEIQNQEFINPAMQRGLDLEPLARRCYEKMSGIPVDPAVVVKGWAMASLDGMYRTGEYIVEIKCPGKKDHAIAIQGKIPAHYMPQLQHQLYVCNLDQMHYFSFDGEQGVIVEVKRDQSFIDKMLKEELKFHICLKQKTPPDPEEGDYVEIDDPLWTLYAEKWQEVQEKKKKLEEQEDHLRKQLIFLSGECNARGAGVTLCQVKRRGNIDYSKIPQLQGIDLEPYRKDNINSWRLTC